MIFWMKRRPGTALALLAALGIVGGIGRGAVGPVPGADARGVELLAWVVGGVVGIGASDGLLHGVLLVAVGEPYRRCHRDLVDWFEPQGAAGVLLGGLAAGAEEVVFRGVVLVGIVRLGAGAPVAVVGAALVFGLAHLVPRRRLAPFGLWAVWEGVLLGAILVGSGSLLVAAAVHVLHDLAGFAWFARVRLVRGVGVDHDGGVGTEETT